ncbi:MAG: DUF1553 domain-containing protein, partial [Pirellulales bacterium]
RGNNRTPGPAAPRRFLQIIAGNEDQPVEIRGSGRLELAQWITDPAHPLTARVMVNRIWQHHFGRGLVATSDNFGKLGERPSHPELLDWLARQFVKGGWSVKAMHRLMLLSSTYQQACIENPAAQYIDPENKLLWRMPRRRLSAEEFRDTLLSVSGTLDPAMGGTLFTEGYQPGDESRKLYVVDISTKDPFPPFQSSRRSIYLPVLRNARPEILKLFDVADEHISISVRGETTVAPQALFLLNSPFVREHAEMLALKLLDFGSSSATIDFAFRLLFGRAPALHEIERIERFVDAYQLITSQRGIDSPQLADHTANAAKAYVHAIRETTRLVTYHQIEVIDFNGQDQRLQVDLPHNLSGAADAMSVEAWVRPAQARAATIIGCDGPSDRLWRIGTELSQSEGQPVSRLFYEFYPAKSGGRRTSSDNYWILPSQQWSHIAATYGAGQRRLYVNGRKVDECAVEATLRPMNVPMTIGARGDDNEWFQGGVNHVALYDRALEDWELSRHFTLFRRCHWPEEDLPQLFAWRAVCQSLLCTHEFIYLE